MITFYGYKKCGTSRKGENKLKELGVEYDFVDITENPPPLAKLKKMYKQSGEEIKKFFNTSGAEYKNLNMKEKIPQMSEAELLAELASNGRLIKRPLITDGEISTVGYQEEKFISAWGKYS